MEIKLVDDDPKPQGGRTLDGSATPDEPAPGAELELDDDPGHAPVDPYLAEANREYEQGQTDLRLWAVAIAKHGDDKLQAVATYLRARATALKLDQRERRKEAPRPRISTPGPSARPLLFASDDKDDFAALQLLLQRQNLRQYVMVAAPFLAALAIGIGIAAWWMVSPNAEDSARNVPAIAANGAVTAASRASASTQPRSPPKAEEDPNAYFSGKVRELKDAGNWNVLVLFASEWTRKKPDNATAWKELSLGYSIMRQHRDALEAGNKAAQLAPDDPQAWRNLGQVNIDLNEPEAALKAFERAVALDELDVHSLLEVGALGTQLNQLPKARAAYERALALNPNDAEALCGMALLAQRQARGMDADAAAKQMRGADRNCRDATGSAAVAVAPQKASSAPRK